MCKYIWGTYIESTGDVGAAMSFLFVISRTNGVL